MQNKSILVIGATGAMGRAVTASILASSKQEFTVRAFTRNPGSEQARKLKDECGERLELVQGDLGDRESIKRALKDVWGVFCNTDFWSSGSVDGEYQEGLRILELAQAEGVQHLVYSSLDDCVQASGGRLPVPHFDSKAAVEHFIDRNRSSEFMLKATDGFYSKHVSVLVTATYFENFAYNFRPNWGQLSDGREGFIFRLAAADKPNPMISLDDIGWFSALMFEEPDKWGGRTLKIGGDAPTMYEVVSAFERVTQIPAEYQPIDLETFRQETNQLAANKYQFNQEYGFPRDYAELRRIHPNLMTFEDWLKKSGWRGEKRELQNKSMATISKDIT